MDPTSGPSLLQKKVIGACGKGQIPDFTGEFTLPALHDERAHDQKKALTPGKARQQKKQEVWLTI